MVPAEFFTFDRILAYIGIGVTVFIAISIFRLQKKDQDKINSIIHNMDEIVKQQSEILSVIEIRRKQIIHWFVHHVGGVLKTLDEAYQELYKRVDEYHTEKSDLNLRKILAEAHTTRDILLNQLIGLAERDIEVAKDYISNPWIIGKFRDVIPLLGWVLNVEEDQIRRMNNEDLIKYKGEIKRSINDIQQYIITIDREEKR